MVFLKAGFLPLVIRNDEHRDAYIDALVSADSGDLSSLVSLFANIQSTDLNEAVTFVRELRGEGISALATAAAGAVKRRIEDDTQQLEAITKELIDVADRRLQEVSFELKQAFEDAGAHIETLIGTDDGSTEGWWRWQIVASARSYNYYADLSRFKHWIQLRLVVPDINAPRWHLVISFHHKETRAGLMAASAFLTNSDVTFEDEREILLGSQTEFTYSTARDPIEEFREWLDGAISRLLEYWQARL